MKNLLIISILFTLIILTAAEVPDDPEKCKSKCTNEKKLCVDTSGDRDYKCKYKSATEYTCSSSWDCPIDWTCKENDKK